MAAICFLYPKKHIDCIGNADREFLEKIDKIDIRIMQYLMIEYGIQSVSIFEHGIVGQTVKHAHIHFMPASCLVGPRIKNDLPQGEVDEVYLWAQLGSMYSVKKEPYLAWHDKSFGHAKKTINWNPSNVPIQYLRTVFAEAIGRPERANWRNVDPVKDRKLILETVERMKKYFK